MNRTPLVTDSPPLSTAYTPSVAGTAASLSGRNQRCEQIVQNFYTKVTQILLQSRILHDFPTTNTSSKKVNKWFNLELEDYKTYKTELKYWRTNCLSAVSPSPMIIEIYLDASELNHRQILVLNDELMQKVRVDIGNGSLSSHLKYIDKISKKQTILLESWQLFLMEPVNSSVIDLPVVYKKSIVFFRSLYTYVRQLPAYRLFRRLRKMKLNGLKLGYRLATAPIAPDNEIDTPISETDTHGSASSHAFDPIDTPLGSFILNVRYRSNCNFCVEDPEAVLSSKFTTTDKEHFLTTSPSEIESQFQDHSYGSRHRDSLESRSYRMSRTSSLRSSHGSQRIQNTGIETTDDYASRHISSTPRAGSSLSPKEYDVRRFSQPPNLRPSPTLSSVGSRHHVRTRSLSGTSGKTPIDIYENESGNEYDGRNSVSGTNQIPTNSLRRPAWNQSSSIYSRSPSSRPSLSLISPFKSPSLSSSPASVHETSGSPSLGSLRKRTSSTSLHQQYTHSSFSRTAATPPPLVSRASTGTTKLASSFGNRYNSEFSREDSRASPGLPRRRRTASLLSNDGLYDNTGRASRPQSRASMLTNQPDEDDVGEFVKLIDDRAPLKMFNSSKTADKGPTNSEIESISNYKLSRFHQLKQENGFLSESILAASMTPVESQQSEHDTHESTAEKSNPSSETKNPLTISDYFGHQVTRANIKSSGSLSMPNSYVAKKIEAFGNANTSVLKPSKSMDTMRRGYFDDESDSESDESEEGKPDYRLDVDNQAFFNNMDSFCW